MQKELSEEESMVLIGKKIGDKISGDGLGFLGYEFEITGGSDDSGVPMRADNPGISRKRILAVEGVGIRKKGKGIRVRKLVAGDTIIEKTAQVNVKVVKEGKIPLFEEKEEKNKEEPAQEQSEEDKETPEENKGTSEENKDSSDQENKEDNQE